MNTVQLLDAVRTAKNLPSDYAAAAALGLTRSQVSRYRVGKDFMSDETARRAAELIGADPAVLMAQMHAERSKDNETRAVWRSIAERLQRAGVAACVILSLGFWSGGPDGGAFAGVAAPSPAFSQGPTVYYVNLIVHLLRRFGRRCRQLARVECPVSFGFNTFGVLADMRS